MINPCFSALVHSDKNYPKTVQIYTEILVMHTYNAHAIKNKQLYKPPLKYCHLKVNDNANSNYPFK